MENMNTLKHSLINVADCVLVLIDIQDSFLAKNPPEIRDLILNRVGWLVEVAKILDVPILVTAEEIDRMGSLSPALAAKIPPGTPVYNKMIFGLVDNPEIYAAINNMGRKTAVLVGLETDVCVAHSALGLLEKGYQVVVIEDATASPGAGAHESGLARINDAGGLITSLKGVYYEWIRTVEMSNMMGRQYGQKLGRPKGIIL
jgi:nicotinamidase-related amidase